MSSELDASWFARLGPTLSERDVRRRLQRDGADVAATVRADRLLGLPTETGALVYPAFQFGEGGRPHPALGSVLEMFDGAVETPYTVAAWFVSPQELLGGETPLGWLGQGGEHELLIEAARSAAASFRQ